MHMTLRDCENVLSRVYRWLALSHSQTAILSHSKSMAYDDWERLTLRLGRSAPAMSLEDSLNRAVAGNRSLNRAYLSACDHTKVKAPDPIRTRKLNTFRPRQYCGGGPRWNPRCCKLFLIFQVFAFFCCCKFYVLMNSMCMYPPSHAIENGNGTCAPPVVFRTDNAQQQQSEMDVGICDFNIILMKCRQIKNHTSNQNAIVNAHAGVVVPKKTSANAQAGVVCTAES